MKTKLINELEEKILDILNYQPHLLGILRFDNDNDILQQYASIIDRPTINTKKIFTKVIENNLYDINYTNNLGNNLLHILCKRNKTQLVIDILRESLIINKKIIIKSNKKSQNVLHYSCYNQNNTLIKELIDYILTTGQPLDIINEPDKDKRTPIVISIKTKNEKMLETLLKQGANPNSFVDEKYIPLHYAIQKRFKKAILLLIKYGAQTFTPTYIKKKSLIEKTKSKFAINLIN